MEPYAALHLNERSYPSGFISKTHYHPADGVAIPSENLFASYEISIIVFSDRVYLLTIKLRRFV